MSKELTIEMIEKARLSKTSEELLAIAKENGIELTEKQVMECFNKLNKSGELSDDELDNVAGGGCTGSEEFERRVREGEISTRDLLVFIN